MNVILFLFFMAVVSIKSMVFSVIFCNVDLILILIIIELFKHNL